MSPLLMITRSRRTFVDLWKTFVDIGRIFVALREHADRAASVSNYRGARLGINESFVLCNLQEMKLHAGLMLWHLFHFRTHIRPQHPTPDIYLLPHKNETHTSGRELFTHSHTLTLTNSLHSLHECAVFIRESLACTPIQRSRGLDPVLGS